MSRRLGLGVCAMSVVLFLALAGCSGGSDSSAPATTEAPATSLPPTVVRAEPVTGPPVFAKLPGVFAPIPYHEYLDVSDAITEATTARFLANPDARAVTALDGRWVTRYGKRVALASVVGLDPKFAAGPGGAQGMVAAVTDGAQSSKQVKLSGETVTVAVDPAGMVTMAWIKGPLVLVLVGRNELRMTPVASALIEANR
jgi:hypothetical protein